jgi:ABC-type molybdate transport system permease subunit
VSLLQRILGNHGVDIMVGGKRPGETLRRVDAAHVLRQLFANAIAASRVGS